MEGGRFDFSDGGSYVGEWSEGRAHGLGIATGPENQGEYSGEWTMGFESRGVYIWPSGNIYSGTWLKGKRHGEGVQVKGRWIYRGAFTTGFCGRYGVKESLTSCAKYEGSWHLNQFDGFGVETNSDGSVYAGAWSRGMRQGLGVRRSAPYALAAEFSRTVRAAQSQNSIPSGTDSERGWRGTGSIGGGSGGDMRTTGDRGRPDERRSGFVLRSISCPSSASHNRSAGNYRDGSEKRSIFSKGLFRKLRKQKSTGDLSVVGGHTMSGLSSLGCGTGGGSGGLFHSRGRRAGGSLRSTLSGTSQITTTSFGRGELKGMGNGGQALQEVMDESVAPGVTETYSGQWNEDRRSGYGIAERSDGLKYVGEWFNNKKDGYGVTYHADGTKEEGKYKENILIQPLNRRSKLFVLRHSKLRDAIEEAVRSAEDASRKAQQNSSESAYQRAQTARMVAKTADERARVARKLSDEARAVAREFSPDFIQLGLDWEKQNPLLKKELFGVSQDASDSVNQSRQFQRNIRMENPTSGDGLAGHRLEVSGGSRQGSFRSSFRRHANNSQDAPSKEHGGRPQEKRWDQQRHGDPNSFNPVDRSREDANWSMQPKSNTGSMGHMGHMNSFEQLVPQNHVGEQRTPAGRPIARAATSGVAGIGYSHTDHRQMAQHMAQHPHSPYLISSKSQHLDNFVDADTAPSYDATSRYRSNQYPATTTLPRNQPTYDTVDYDPTQGRHTMSVGSAHLSKARAHRAAEIRLAETQLVQPPEYLFATIEPVETVNRNQLKTDRLIGRTETQGATVTLDTLKLSEVQTILPRRRTLPSIMTEPPIHPAKSGPNKWGMKQGASTLRPPEVHVRTTSFDDDAIHSAENLPAQAIETFIIENGIRKRVQAVSRLQQAHLPPAMKLPEDDEKEGRRPEWTTAYDPYRPAMESTMVLSQLGNPPAYPHKQPQSPDQSPLPQVYYIGSELSILGTNKESSMPDLSSACHSMDAAYKRGHARHTGLTRDELIRLTQARRMELMEELERRKRGEIVIRLADIKDWIRDNFVIVFVLLINASLAFLFFNLLTGSSESSTSRSIPSRPEPPPTIPSQTARLAKKLMSDALKKAKANRRLGIPD